MTVGAVRVAKCRVLARLRAAVAEWEKADMTTPCSVDLLESALAGDLPPEREELLHRHLEECEACAAALEQMAGGEAWCQEAAALLTGDELDDAVPARDRMVQRRFHGRTPGALRRAGRAGAAGRLRRAGDHRARRHGGRAQGVRPRVEALRGHQGALAASGPKLAGQEAVRPRGPGGRGGRPSQRAGDPPGAARRAVAVPGHAAGGRRIAGPAAGRARPAGTQGDPCASACRRRPVWPRPTSRAWCIAT